MNRFLKKTMKVNKIATKNFSKICRSKSTLNCRSHHLWIKWTYTTWVTLQFCGFIFMTNIKGIGPYSYHVLCWNYENIRRNSIYRYQIWMAAFENVSIQSLYAVILLYINYVDMQSNQTMHQLLIRCLIFFYCVKNTYWRRFKIEYIVYILYSLIKKHDTLFKHKATNILKGCQSVYIVTRKKTT